VSGPRVLVVGQGGREHALVDAIHRSGERPRVFAAPGSQGMEPLAERVPLPATDLAGISRWSREHAIDLVVIGPDAAVAMGMADALRDQGIDTLGPGRLAARLESSKRYAKELLQKLGLPTAAFRIAESPGEADQAVDRARFPLVLKADGLAAGKGVVVARDRDEARGTVDAWMRRGAIGEAARTLVLEEYLEGEEASVLLLSDGERWALFPPARDHKRVGEGDTGPNTGGMGAFAPARVPTAKQVLEIGERIASPLIEALRLDGTPYRGVLYLGLMLTAKGPMVLEVNARFGDPEAQVILPLMTEDILPLFRAAARGDLPRERHGSFLAHEGAAVCVVLASRGYPGTPETGVPVEGLDGPWPHGISIYHAGVDRREGRWVTNGGRVVGVTARAETVERAREAAYAAAAKIRFEGMHFRRDIATAPEPSGATSHGR
jgi:phosphoribosylamine---glycine ligase